MNAIAFDLPEETRALQAVARGFARDVLAPKALQWDKEQHFPVAEMREAAGWTTRRFRGIAPSLEGYRAIRRDDACADGNRCAGSG